METFSLPFDEFDFSECLCPSANTVNNYTVYADTLGAHLVNSEIEYVQTYDGSVIEEWPAGAVSVLGLGDDALRGDPFDSISGMSRGVCGTYGLGRYCIFSEAQTITSKCAPSGCSSRVTGFNGHRNGTPDAEYNELFALQVFRWLDDGTITGGSG